MKRFSTFLLALFSTVSFAQSIKVVAGAASIGICAGCGSIKNATPNLPSMLVVALQPQSQSVYQGSSVTVTAAVSGGISPYVYHQIVNGVEVGTGASKSISSASIIYFHVTDAANNYINTNTATITIIPTLAIASQPSPLTLNAGQSGSFTATSTGGVGTSRNWTWYKNGLSVGGVTTNTYNYSGASIADSGVNVYAIVNDGNGHTATTSAVKLIVHDTTGQSGNTIPISFSVPLGQRASIGIYDASGKVMLRNLVKGDTFPTVNNTIYFDGKGDDGNLLPNGTKVVRKITNGLKAKFIPIGNNSDSNHGPNIWYQSNVVGMAFVSNTVGLALKQQTEAGLPVFGFNPSSPHRKYDVISNTTYQTNNDITTDGTNWYITTYDSYQGSVYFTYLVDVATGLTKNVSGSFPITNNSLTMYAIDTTTNSNNPTVSSASNSTLFFSGHPSSITVYDKSTWAKLYTVNIGANKMATDNSGHLFTVTDSVRMYNANSSGLTFVKSFSGVNYPLSVRISPNMDTLAVCDIGDNNVKKISIANGGISHIGDVNHYYSNATVTDTSFYFRDVRNVYHAYAEYQPNGALWVGDFGNNRNLKFIGNNLADKIEYQPGSYSSGVDPTDPTHFYLGYLRFDIDFSNPYNPTAKLAKNYGAKRPPTNVGTFQDYARPANYFSKNGHTYTSSFDGAKYGNILNVLYEVKDTGWRETPITFNGQIDSALNILRQNCSDGTCNVGTYYQLYATKCTGLDGSFNPTYAAEVNLVTRVITANAPVSAIQNLSARFSDSSLLLFEATNAPNKYKVGILKDTLFTKLTANTLPNTYNGQFPNDGAYDEQVAVGQSGTIAFVNTETNIGGYHFKGEGYKGQYQTNYIDWTDSSGQFLYQSGTDQFIATELNPLGLASNTQIVTPFRKNGYLYTFQASESFCGCGLITLLDSVQTISRSNSTITINGTPTVPYAGFNDLMAGLPRFSTPTGSNYGGWTFDTRDAGFITKTNYSTYKPTEQDVRFEFGEPTSVVKSNSVAITSKVLPTYRLKGNIGWTDGRANNTSNEDNAYTFINDNTGTPIVSIENNRQSDGTFNVYFNNVLVMANAPTKNFTPFTLDWNGSIFTFSMFGQTVTAGLYNSGGNGSYPASFGVSFATAGGAHGRVIDIGNLKISSSSLP